MEQGLKPQSNYTNIAAETRRTHCLQAEFATLLSNGFSSDRQTRDCAALFSSGLFCSACMWFWEKVCVRACMCACMCALGGRESGMNAKSCDLCTGSDWTPTGRWVCLCNCQSWMMYEITLRFYSPSGCRVCRQRVLIKRRGRRGERENQNRHSTSVLQKKGGKCVCICMLFTPPWK